MLWFTRMGENSRKYGVIQSLNRPPCESLDPNKELREAEALFKKSHDRSGCLAHGETSLPEMVPIGDWRGDLVDGYINREIGVCVHFHSLNPPIKGEYRDLVFVFQQSTLENGHTLKFHAKGKAQFGAGVRKPGADNMKLSVPVLSCPIIQDAERSIKVKGLFLRREGRSVVRLYGFNDVATFLLQWYLPAGQLECSFAGADRKFKVLLIGGRVLIGLKDGGLINTSVKSGTELVEHFSKFETKDWGETGHRDDKDSPCPVCINVNSGGVGVVVNKVVPDFGEGFAMHLCPFDALPAPLEWN